MQFNLPCLAKRGYAKGIYKPKKRLLSFKLW